MTYELGKTYFHVNRPLILKAVWYEDEITYAAIRFKDHGQQLIIPLAQLVETKTIKKRINLSVELKPDNTLEVSLLNLALREEQKINFYQASFDIIVKVDDV